MALEKFLETFCIDMLIRENALAIPMRIPLGVVWTELIAERRIPTISHHQDFYLEGSSI